MPKTAPLHTPHNAWIVVQPADHIANCVSLGIVQVNHGQREGLERMAPGDIIVSYAPTAVFHEGPPLRAFTACGFVEDAPIWQDDKPGDLPGDRGNKPFRRKVRYVQAAGRTLPVADVKDKLDLTEGPHWGHRVRRGLDPLSMKDAKLIMAELEKEPRESPNEGRNDD